MRRQFRPKHLWLCLVASGAVTLTTCGLSDRQWTEIWQSVVTSALTSSASAAITAASSTGTTTGP